MISGSAGTVGCAGAENGISNTVGSLTFLNLRVVR